MAATRAPSFKPLCTGSFDRSMWKSSNGPTPPRASRSCQNVGSSNAPSLGSIAAAASPRTGSASTERPSRSCDWRQSDSCSESYVRKENDPGQTLTKQLGRDPNRFSHVKLSCQPADDWSGTEFDRYDVVVINSVIQYFPSARYLLA